MIPSRLPRFRPARLLMAKSLKPMNGFDVEKWIGITRPFHATLLIATTCYLAIAGTVDGKDFLGLATVVVLFIFKDRSDEKTQSKVIEQIKELKKEGS